MRALYLEDNEFDAELARRVLEKAVPPIEVDIAGTVAGALELLANDADRYSWVLFDLSLPDGDGLQVLRYVRQNQLPLAMLAVTGSGDEQSVVKALKLGADDYIIKQHDYLDSLVDTLHKVLRRPPRLDTEQRPLQILFVADKPDEAAVVLRSLADNAPHLVIDTLWECSRVLPRLHWNHFDVLLIDCEETAVDMLELIKRIRHREQNTIPIVVVTALGSEAIAAQALRLGVTDYVIKDDAWLLQLPAVLESAYTRAQLHDVALRHEYLRASQEAIEAANQQKSRFLASMSHEIRTPLNGILGLLFLLQKDDIPEQLRRDYFKMAEQSGQYLLQIINDVLDLSKVEAGRMELEQADFRLDALLSGVRSVLAMQAEAKGLRLLVDIHGDVPLELNGDSLRLQQVLLNLAGNAIKFTEAGEVAVSVAAKSAGEAGIGLQFAVKDTGIGMTEAQRKALFEPFNQADTTISRRYGGTGLGLALCREFATLMGGKIDVSSEPGKGSEFIFDVCLAPAQGVPPKGSASLPDKGSAGNPGIRRGANILLVEDNKINQVVTAAYLQHLRLNVDICDGGEAAVEAMRRHAAGHYQLILMDLQMPGMDGFAATVAIRALPTGGDIPIIAMTASIAREDHERSREVGMNDILVKPVRHPVLVATLSQWLPVN